MEAKDLKIGNYIIDPNGGELVQVFSLDNEDNILIINGFFEDDIKPKEISREIFEKFGFEQIGDLEYSIYNEEKEYTFTVEFDGQYFWLSCGMSLKLSKKKKYIHELQNLFIEITGDELSFQQHTT